MEKTIILDMLDKLPKNYKILVSNKELSKGDLVWKNDKWNEQIFIGDGIFNKKIKFPVARKFEKE